MGIQSYERVGRLIEGIKILRRVWSEERVSHEGKYYSFTDVEVVPKPVQKPVPIYIAVNPKEKPGVDPRILDRALRRVAKYGDGWQCAGGTTTEMFRQRFDTIRDYAAQEGRDPSKLESCLHMIVNINDDREAAFNDATEFLAKYYGVGRHSKEDTEIWLAYGPPEAVAEKIRSYIDAGCTTPVLRFAAADLRGQLQRCMEEVLPAIPGVERRTVIGSATT